MRTSLFAVLMHVSGEGMAACGRVGGVRSGSGKVTLTGARVDGRRTSKLRTMGIGDWSWIRPPWRSSRVDLPTDTLERGRRHRRQPHVVRPPQQQVHHTERDKATPIGWRKTERREREIAMTD
jgi:hypothetical protein